jgi:uncharacterized protein involved in outer membrane biogenesis
MTRPIRWLFRIALGLFILGVAAVVAAIFLRDTIVREVLTRRMRAATGMEVKIGSVHVGLRSPTMTIKGFKLYNTAAFGGSLCLDMPELHVEYDPAAARSGTIHLPLVRLNLARIELVKDKQGRSNFDAIEKQGKQSAPHANSLNGFKFGGIDTLNLSFGKLLVSDLRSGEEEEVDFGIKNQILHNVKSQADLTGVAVLLAMRGSSSAGHSGIDFNELLNDLTSH